ncbi:MAG: S41 family peptidase, partial [Fibrobacterales bacterium]|nr:S41 family peptidase [Fibrobacterales bacterium]
REGMPETMKVKLTRDRIQIHSVPYFGMLDKETGYVKVITFAKKTAEDLAAAIEELKGKGMKKLVLDLRHNPGGLLEQAVEVSSLFLEEGSLIVSTRGRTEQTESRSEAAPRLDKDVPMVVLVNAGSASAAEIVSGALQDWDRAVVMGDTTFGKGSVQTIFPLDNDGFALKLTTAFYYLPMGRCINRPENGVRGNRAEEEEEEESGEAAGAREDAKADTAAKAPEKTFRTASGRLMTGEGGIVPDVVVLPDTLNTVQYLLERHTMFFKFAVHYRPELEKRKVRVNEGWKVPNDVLKAFQDFVAADTNFAKSKTRAESALAYFEETLQKELELERDSVGARPQLKEPIEKLRAALAERHRSALAADPEFLREGIKRELLGAFLGEKARAGYALKSDRPVQEAVRLLKDEAAFRKLLTPAPEAEKTSKEK